MHRGLLKGAIVLVLLTAAAGLRAATIDLSSLGCYGVLTGPSGSPSPRTVCVGLRFANIEGVPQRSCADPSR